MALNVINATFMFSFVLFLFLGPNIHVTAVDNEAGDYKLNTAGAPPPAATAGAPKLPITPADGDVTTGEPISTVDGHVIAGTASSGSPMLKVDGKEVDGGVNTGTPMMDAGGKIVDGGAVSGTPMVNSRGKEASVGATSIGASMLNSGGTEVEASPASGDAVGRKQAAAPGRR